MVNFCLMASHAYLPGLIIHQQLDLGGSGITNKGYQQLVPSLVVKQEIIRYRFHHVRPYPFEELMKSQSEWYTSKKFLKVDLAAQLPMLNPVAADCSNSAFLKLGIAEAHVASLSELIDLQLLGIDELQQTLSFYASKPLLNYLGDSALTSKLIDHPDPLTLTFVGTEADTRNSPKPQKHFMLIPHFGRRNINEAEARSHSSASKTQSRFTKTFKSPEKVKKSPKNKKVSKIRDLYEKNYSYACERFLSFLFEYRRCPETAILSLKKSGPELPELLSIHVAGTICGIGLTILLCFLSKVCYGRVSFWDFNPLHISFGFGLQWISLAVHKLGHTIYRIQHNVGKKSLKDGEVIQEVHKNLCDIYNGAAVLLIMAVASLFA